MAATRCPVPQVYNRSLRHAPKIYEPFGCPKQDNDLGVAVYRTETALTSEQRSGLLSTTIVDQSRLSRCQLHKKEVRRGPIGLWLLKTAS